MGVWIISFFTGFFIELFFRLIKRNKDANPPTKYIAYNNYVSVSEFVNLGNRRWLNYLAFRFFPPALLLVLSIAIYREYFKVTYAYSFVLFSTMVSLFPRDVVQLFKKDTYFSEKAIHLLNIASLLSIATLLSFVGTQLDLSFIAPSISGIIDNSWSTLLVALLIILYTDITNQKTTEKDASVARGKLKDFVLSAHKRLKSRFGILITDEAKNKNVSLNLLYSIIIYEDLNRPKIMRSIENLIVKLTKRELTVGIAQVKSSVPLSDTESIKKACDKLSNTSEIVADAHQLRPLILSYNNSESYYTSIMDILSILNSFGD